jgi:hypothetical protein
LLASTQPHDFEAQFQIYSDLEHLDPANKDYTKKKNQVEPAMRKQQEAKRLAEDQLRNPEDFIKIVDFRWSKGGFDNVMLVSST